MGDGSNLAELSRLPVEEIRIIEADAGRESIEQRPHLHTK